MNRDDEESINAALSYAKDSSLAQNDKLALSNEFPEKTQPLAVSGIIYLGEAKLPKTK
jgi:hypothetical protein